METEVRDRDRDRSSTWGGKTGGISKGKSQKSRSQTCIISGEDAIS